MLKYLKRKYWKSLIIFFLWGGPAYSAEIICLNEQNTSLLPHGKEVDGMEGDWLIRNDLVMVVIGAAYPDREANQMVSSIQGAVIDYTTLTADNDQLVVYYPQGARVDVPSADTIFILQAKGNSVQLQAVKYPTASEPFTATTLYTLQDGEPFLRVKTTYKNTADKAIPVRVYDQLRCDNKLDDVAPKGETHLAYIDNKWYRADRVINLAASGIEFAPATEHNRISTYTGVIREAGLQSYIASAAGIELSGRPGPGAINHQIAFPLKMQPGQRGYGAPKTDADPLVQMSRLYHYDHDHFKLMQQNHPDIGWLYFDKNRDGKVDDGFGTAGITDVMEIRETMADLPEAVNGGNTDSRSFYWLQMLNLGYHIYGTANSDNHTVGHASGSMFNYVYTAHDKPEEIDPVEIAQQIKKGHVVISDGPFMDVRVNEALPGEEIKAPEGSIRVHIKVLAARWAPVNTVQILINGRADSALIFNQKNHPEWFKEGAAVFEKNIPITLKTDAHIIVMAYGKGETISLVTGGGKMKNALPIAISNPVFVDVDGHGFTPNKDLLGKPLPTHKIKE